MISHDLRCVLSLGLGAPPAAIDRLFDTWASPETIQAASRPSTREQAAHPSEASHPSDLLCLTELSGALKRGGAPRHVKEAAAAHKRIHHDQPIRQAELTPPPPPAAAASDGPAGAFAFMQKRNVSFKSFLLDVNEHDGGAQTYAPTAAAQLGGGASSKIFGAVSAASAAGSMQQGGAMGGLKRLKQAVKRMKIKEEAKTELMTLIGRWSMDKLQLLEGLFQNAELMQTQIDLWKTQPGNKSTINAGDTHLLLKRLRLSTGANERQKHLLSDTIFDELDQKQSGYISLDDLSLAMWQKANEEIWRLYKEAKNAEHAGEAGARAGAADDQSARLSSPPPGAVADHLRSALVEQAQRVIDLFKSWDQDGDGTITKGEFRKALPELGLWAKPEDVDELFDSFDTDGGGSISFRELNRMLRRTRVVEHKTTKKEGPVGPEVADVNELRKEIFKRVRTDAVHASIDAKLNAADAPAAELPHAS